NPRQLVLSPDDDLGSVPGVKLPSVSAILGCTRSSDTAERLYKWQQRIVRQKGLDGFKQYMKG
uniref:Uncharacterized protein n=1 Tax=Plectus sambesii TaxID=2011161 RepID=A0A914VFZ1_9BILA